MCTDLLLLRIVPVFITIYKLSLAVSLRKLFTEKDEFQADCILITTKNRTNITKSCHFIRVKLRNQ